MNDTSDDTIKEVQEYLQEVKDNAYSFETDSAKADMITGKVVAGYQWSGDAVYTMDQADKDDFTLNFAVPKESTNIYFDGWVMLKSGIGGNDEKSRQHRALLISSQCRKCCQKHVLHRLYFCYIRREQ